MKKEFLEKTTQYLRFQRNILAALSFLLSVSIVLLCTFLFLKRERVIITPPVVEKEFWVDADKVSPTYLEQYGCFLGQLLLSKSAQSALMQRTVLLRHADPSFAETLKQKLFEEEQVLQKQSASYTFFPVTI
ncbi:MAG TPA: TraE/TraK family type IV conjugative transfer system protein, partial [Waddliaceae bacterium]